MKNKRKIMKLLIILFIGLFSLNSSVFAQHLVYPPAFKLIKEYGSLITRTQDKFILGWNWGSPCRTLDEAMCINSYHHFPFSSSDVAENISVIGVANDVVPRAWRKDTIVVMGGRHDNALSNSHALHLDPTIRLNDSGKVLERANPSEYSIFGFREKNMNICRLEKDETGKHQLTLKRENLTSGYRDPVLSKIYNGSIMRWLDYAGRTSESTKALINSRSDSAKYHDFNGKQLYLSIDLRAIDTNQLNANLDKTILTIRMKYDLVTKRDTLRDSLSYGHIIFSKFPDTLKPSQWELVGENNQNRGLVRRVRAGHPDKEFRITGKMLKTLSDYRFLSPRNYVTLSAFAELTGAKEDNEYINNPCLKNDWWQNYGELEEYITNLDVEVFYHGLVDVAINWIRIETPRAQDWLRGKNDNDIFGAVNDLLRAAAAHPQKPKIFRFYGNDELIPSEWQAMKYYNCLVDSLLAIEWFPSNKDYPGEGSSEYLNYTNSKELWTGCNIVPKMSSAVPYYQRGRSDMHTSHVGYKYGYKGNEHIPIIDSLNSGYETLLTGAYGIANSTVIKPFSSLASINPYELDWSETGTNTFYSNGTLYSNERQMYYGYYGQQDMLYNSKPWWSNHWVNSESWVVDTNFLALKLFSADATSRPKTGEEIRLSLSTSVLLGTKGMYYWFKKTERSMGLDTIHIKDSTSGAIRDSLVSRNVWLGLLPIGYTSDNSLTGDSLVLSETIGGDYVMPTNDPNGFSNFLNPNVYSFDSLGVDQNGIYKGLKSTRLEIQKINKWITRLEKMNDSLPNIYPNDLMDLRLMAWKGKGFKTWYSQDPLITRPEIMNKYIKKDSIKTAKLYQPNLGHTSITNLNYENVDNYLNVDHYESDPDSTFYDVSVFRTKKQGLGTAVDFYLGIQNRRTDPLIFKVDDNTARLEFNSTADFEEKCQNPTTASMYQDYYWKRLGCRLIEVPLASHYAHRADPKLIHESFTVRIKEVLATDKYFNDTLNPRWRSSKYSHLPNTYIAFSDSAPIIKVKLLPGEGKLLKVSKDFKPLVNSFESNCPDYTKLNLKFDLIRTVNNDLEFRVVLENKTPTNFPQLAVILEDKNGDTLNIQSESNSEIADYQEDVTVYPNRKALIAYGIQPNSVNNVGRIRIPKNHSMKYLFRFDVITDSSYSCPNKYSVNVNLLNKKSAEDIESFDNRISNISIAPNPAKDRAELSFTATEQGNAEIIVVDILGNQLIRISDYIAYPGANSLNINLSNFSGGVYNVIVKTISGVSTQKFSVVK